MNVATYLMLTVPLVGGSLFLYDNLKSPSRPVHDEVSEIQAPSPRETVRGETGPLLQGDNTLQIERLVRESVERMLRERTGGAPTPSPTTSTDVVSGGGPLTLPEVPAIDVPGDPLVEGPAGKFDEKTVAVLRSYMDEIQRREREERAVQMVNSSLDRLGVALTDSQRKGVIDATLQHQRQVRDSLRTLTPGQDNREARTKAVQDAREQYQKTIYDLVPSAEAEKIVSSLGQGVRGPGGMQGGNGVGPGGGSGRRGTGGQGN